MAVATGAGGSGMALSCAWDPHCSGRVLASSSNGSLSVVDLGEGGASVASTWHAHDYEAWIVTADSHMVRSPRNPAHICAECVPHSGELP